MFAATNKHPSLNVSIEVAHAEEFNVNLFFGNKQPIKSNHRQLADRQLAVSDRQLTDNWQTNNEQTTNYKTIPCIGEDFAGKKVRVLSLERSA